jgi:hypothetical protein
MNKRNFLMIAASVFAAGTIATAAHAEACKGQSACKGGQSPAKGQNACKGQGWAETADAKACTTAGGKVM